MSLNSTQIIVEEIGARNIYTLLYQRFRLLVVNVSWHTSDLLVTTEHFLNANIDKKLKRLSVI